MTILSLRFAMTIVSDEPSETVAVVSAEESQKRLVAGNDRFLSNHPQHPHEASEWRNKLEEGQHPFAVVVGCSDSRVPPELIFDQGLAVCRTWFQKSS